LSSRFRIAFGASPAYAIHSLAFAVLFGDREKSDWDCADMCGLKKETAPISRGRLVKLAIASPISYFFFFAGAAFFFGAAFFLVAYFIRLILPYIKVRATD
jgi:hypothetical protein